MTIELIPVPGNKPSAGKYTFELFGYTFGVTFARNGIDYIWNLTTSEGRMIAFFSNKADLLKHVEKMENTHKRRVEFTERSTNGITVKIRLVLEYLSSGSLLGTILTDVHNDDRSAIADNWLMRTVFEYCLNNDIPKPNRVIFQWGKY